MSIDVLDVLRARKTTPLENYFDLIQLPMPMNYYLSPQDIEYLRKLATSVRYSGKIKEKYKLIDDLMRSRGFKRFSAGTNRVVYSYLEDTSFLVKIAVDKVGMQDNPMEFKNQFLLKPYVTKMFCVSPCGTVGFVERVVPIKNVGEFKEIASDVFDIIVNKILGNYVVEDIGTKYFMNWGIRLGYSPVLLDYPYVYKLDGKKLYCNQYIPETNSICNGEIDYNSGFNHLVCSKCNKVYLAVDLRDKSEDNKKIIVKRGGLSMKVQLRRGDEIVYDPIPTDDVIRNYNKPKPENKTMKVCLVTSDGEEYHVPGSYEEENVTSVTDDAPLDEVHHEEENAEAEIEVEVVEPTAIDASPSDDSYDEDGDDLDTSYSQESDEDAICDKELIKIEEKNDNDEKEKGVNEKEEELHESDTHIADGDTCTEVGYNDSQTSNTGKEDAHQVSENSNSTRKINRDSRGRFISTNATGNASKRRNRSKNKS